MITLSDTELVRLTGYRRPGDQLAELHRRGFFRARRAREVGKVVLERAHYEAVRAAAEAAPEKSEPEIDPEIFVPRTKPVHWRNRPEHQERLRRDREYRQQREAENAEARRIGEAAVAAYRADQPLRRAALVRHHANKRRVAKLQRTPPWADQQKIRQVYDEALRRQVETGVVHHVDHIIPLQGRLVSGLHVESNLQILTWRENVKKRNHFEVEP